MKSTLLKIFIWNANANHIGHMSLYIPDSYLYVSFWPDENVCGKKSVAFEHVEATFNTYEEDIRAEERKEDEVLEEIVQLDINAMERQWEWIKSNQRYSLASFNCVNAVLEVLSAGNKWQGFRQVFAFENEGLGQKFHENEKFPERIYYRVLKFIIEAYKYLFGSIAKSVTEFSVKIDQKKSGKPGSKRDLV